MADSSDTDGLGVLPIPTTRPDLAAFRLTGDIAAQDMQFMGRVVNRAFDRLGAIDMLIVFEDDVRFHPSVVASPAALKAEFRALSQVRRYVTIGAPVVAKVMIEIMDRLIPPDAVTLTHEAEAEGWRSVGAAPLPVPGNLSRLEWEAMAAVVARAHLAVQEDGSAGIASAILHEGRLIAIGVNEVHLQNDPSRHAEIVAMARAGKTRGSSDLSGCTLLSSLQPCEMCLAALRFAGIERVIFAAGKARVAPRYFVFPGLQIDDFIAAAPHPFTVIGGVQEAEVLPLYADGQE